MHARPSIPEIGVTALAEARRSEPAPLVLDVREGWEHALVSLPDSLHVPMGDVPGALDRLPRDRQIVVMCHHGMRSARVTGWLRGQGFENAVNLTGGIDAWAREIDPSMGTY